MQSKNDSIYNKYNVDVNDAIQRRTGETSAFLNETRTALAIGEIYDYSNVIELFQFTRWLDEISFKK